MEIRFTRGNASTTFFHLISKTGCSFPVLQFTSFKSHEEKVKVTCFHTPSQGCLPGKTGYLNQKSKQGRDRRTGEGKTSCSEGHTAATSSGKSIVFCLSQFSGCLKDPGLPISSLFWHIYIGSGSAQCGRWSPLGWAGETLPFAFYGFKRLKQLRAPWFNEVSSNLTPKSLKTSQHFCFHAFHNHLETRTIFQLSKWWMCVHILQVLPR